MIALVLAGLVLGSAALVLAGSRRRPERRPVRVRAEGRKDRERRR